YEGALAERMLAAAEAAGAGWAAADLGDHRSEWVNPVAVEYGDVRLHEIPPNGQGLAALIAAGVLDRLRPAGLARDSAESLHLQIEAMKIGFAEAHRHIADPDFGTVPVDALLEPSALAARASAVDRARAGAPAPTVFPDHGTVYLAAADASGMMVSFIQSNYMGFGSGIVVPGTGISLQNRACGFSLEPGHPNEVAGGKRPFHTIIPGFVTRDGHADLAFGVMGGPMQPQGHLQMIHRIYDHGQDVQQAADAPRWFVHDDGSVTLEPGFPDGTADGLRERGHRIIPSDDAGLFGGAQLIRKGTAGWIGGSDPRKDGMAAGY
ncbi:MAG: gamma-glutamyltransferase, partial [Gemmatimonadetes bacterium]|nr:gamma-glutamyltransferase [Gemmatimonadota bacterium]